MILNDRNEAAQILAKRLMEYHGQRPLVLAIPRGAVPMGKVIADTLGGDLDVVLVRKIRAPFHPEVAMGSVDESGEIYPGSYWSGLDVDDAYLKTEIAFQLNVIRERRAVYTPIRPPISPRNRIVIVVDDGVATGSTVIAAVQSIRRKNPLRVIVAVGVAAPEAESNLRRIVDEVVCVVTPPAFRSVGEFYRNFPQVTDEAVMEILRQTGKRISLEVVDQ